MQRSALFLACMVLAMDIAAHADPLGTASLSKKTHHEWEIVVAPSAQAYTKTVKKFAALKAGRTVKVTGYAKSDKRKMAVCRLDTLTSTFIISTNDLRVFQGKFENVDSAVLELRIHSARLEAKKIKLEAELSGVRKNYPHYAAYTKAREAYGAYWKKVKELKQLRENTSHDARMRTEDELRRLKPDDFSIGTTYHDVKVKYDKWHASQPPKVDPKIAELVTRIELLEARIEAFEDGQ